jgi:hypothetical protein
MAAADSRWHTTVVVEPGRDELGLKSRAEVGTAAHVLIR